MKSNAIVAKHPLHPMLIPIPIASYMLALIGDFAYLGTRNRFWHDFSTWSMRIGTVGAALAAVPGLIDYGTVVPRQAKKHATAHALINVGTMGLFIGNLFLRSSEDTTHGKAMAASITMTTIGNAALVYSGWLGGHLVYEHKVGVVESEKGESEAPNFRISLAPAQQNETIEPDELKQEAEAH